MNPQTMTQDELNAMSVLATQFSTVWQPHLAEVVLATELAAFMEPVPTGLAHDMEVESCAGWLIECNKGRAVAMDLAACKEE